MENKTIDGDEVEETHIIPLREDDVQRSSEERLIDQKSQQPGLIHRVRSSRRSSGEVERTSRGRSIHKHSTLERARCRSSSGELLRQDLLKAMSRRQHSRYRDDDEVKRKRYHREYALTKRSRVYSSSLSSSGNDLRDCKHISRRRSREPREQRRRTRKRNLSSSYSEVSSRVTGSKKRIDHYSSDDRERGKMKRTRGTGTHSKDLRGDDFLVKFLDALKGVKMSNSKLSLNNVIPEFDPTAESQTIIMWLNKVEECAEIYGWDERETIHFALPKLSGVAKTWYKGLSSVLYSWSEWKRKLLDSFPCRTDYAELLVEMLNKKVRYGESLEYYYYHKINLLNRCHIKGRRAVDCLLNGVEDRAVKLGAQAVQFREPEDVLRYFKTVTGHSREFNRHRYENEYPQPSVSTTRSNDYKNIKCYNCSEDGHKSFKCIKAPAKCSICTRQGHLGIYCRDNPNANKEKPQYTKTEA